MLWANESYQNIIVIRLLTFYMSLVHCLFCVLNQKIQTNELCVYNYIISSASTLSNKYYWKKTLSLIVPIRIGIKKLFLFNGSFLVFEKYYEYYFETPIRLKLYKYNILYIY